VAQLEGLDEFVIRKRRMGVLYNELLADLDTIEKPLLKTDYAENIYWVYGVILKEAITCNAAEVITRLGKEGIGTRPFFYPMHQQPVFQKMGLFNKECHPVAERLAERGFYLPSGLALEEKQIRHVAYITGCILEDSMKY
jgi:perosamine synthetase